MKVSLEEVKSLLASAAVKFVNQSEADYYADMTLETHLKKYPRTNPVAESLPELSVWRRNLTKEVTKVHEKAGVLIYDFNGLAPALKIKLIHDELENRAKEHGLAAVGIYNSSGLYTLNMWADGLAKRDLIGIAMFNGGVGRAVPYGGKRGVMGTNPFNYAIPTADKAILLDMATTEIPLFEIVDAKNKKRPIKPNSALDNEGRPTTDASRAHTGLRTNLLPIGGGFKGYGIMLLIEILTGTLVRSLLSTEQTRPWQPTESGCLVLALDIGSFTDPISFKTDVSKMCEVLRNEPTAPGFESVNIPGDLEHAKVTQALECGFIDIENKVMDALQDAAK